MAQQRDKRAIVVMGGFQAGFCLLGGLSLCHRPVPDASVGMGGGIAIEGRRLKSGEADKNRGGRDPTDTRGT